MSTNWEAAEPFTPFPKAGRPRILLPPSREPLGAIVLHLIPFGTSERLGRVGSLRFRHDVRPEPPVRQIVEVEELRGATIIEPDFEAAAVLNGFVLSEVYTGHAPMMPRPVRSRKLSIG